jgi:hypothetical protein
MLGELEPGDRKLGDLLQSLELVDADTLHALLLQARRQRRSLRQLLLAGNYLTLFQLALIEAGNLEGLALGPVRVIDRVHAGAAELRYRVFDPRRSQEALFRHLSEEVADDPVRPDEFRQRFNALAAVKHPHVASTYEVFELAGRPAALQEWLTGVPSNDWPSAVLAGAPGVLYRLLSQAALSLQTIHEAGIVHGRLEPGSFVLTPSGLIKLVGAGEPSWLTDSQAVENAGEPSVEMDLAAFGQVVRLWLTAALKRGKKSRQLPEGFFTVLERLVSDDPAVRFTSASEVLQVLDEAGADVPPNATAWERFVQQARELHAQQTNRHSAYP